ncbi:hypothetical protein OJ963_40445 [Streptomyces sp. RS2]|uniref:hypothetical protein n=1 Tax=Streptomyces TaxID=1883 RepID=UPI0021F832C8|nr:hypothetical protein [Streptomyces sp. RS2]MCW1100063.1 hypothetical protein [Streptomyces sp. RS2]
MEQALARDQIRRRSPYWYGAPDHKIAPDEYSTVQRLARVWADNWFNDKEVTAWLALGVQSPGDAAGWRKQGFDATSAAAWLAIRVQSSTAAIFTAAGVTPAMLDTAYAMKGKALRGGKLTLQRALEHQDVTPEEICTELRRLGAIPQQRP